MKQRLSAPQLAEEFTVSVNKIHAWIESGELRAVNLATKRDGRPRYSIRREDVDAFERSREATPSVVPRASARKRRRTVKQYV
jgi:predicted site-specific integrase-resolvase